MKQTDNFKFDEANVMNELVYRNLSEDEKRQICAWKYGGEYDLYNLPSYEEMQVRQIGFMNPQRKKIIMVFGMKAYWQDLSIYWRKKKRYLSEQA